MVVIAAVVIGIVALTSNNSKKTSNAAKQTTTTTTASNTTTTAGVTSADKAAQASANAKAVAAGCPASTATTVNTQQYASAPPMTIDTTKNYSATVVTTAGTFTIDLDAKTAPITVNNFV